MSLFECDMVAGIEIAASLGVPWILGAALLGTLRGIRLLTVTTWDVGIRAQDFCCTQSFLTQL